MQSPRSSTILYILPSVVGGYLLIYFLAGERVTYNGGLGFDGYLYGHLAADFPAVLARKIPEYYLDRILPSLVVWFSAAILHFPLSDTDRIVKAFHIYNSILLVGAAFAWARLSRTLRLSTEAAILGSACLFLNWTITKQYLYFSVQTDTTAFALGVCAALCLIERRYLLLTVIAVATSFAFKAVLPMVALLIVFPVPVAERPSSRFEAWPCIMAAVVACAAVLYITLWSGFSLRAGAAQVDLVTLPLSIVILATYVYYVARSTPVFGILACYRVGPTEQIGLLLGLWALRAILLAVLFRLFANDAGVLDLETFVMGTFALSVAKPGIFIIAYVVTFGPAFILVLLHLRRVMEAAAAHSAGAVLFLIVTLAMAIGETRAMTFAYPFLVTFLCIALQNAGVERRFVIVFLAISILLSRFYLPLNALGMGALGPGPLTDIGDLLKFPWQWFFMNNGPYMAWLGYAVNLALVILAGVTLISGRSCRAAHQSQPCCSRTSSHRSLGQNK
jgi:hypothetical protein